MNNKFKILYYESSSGFGGSSSALVNLIRSLDKNKFYPIVAIKNFGFQIDKIRNFEIIKLQDYIEFNDLTKLKVKFSIFFIKNVIPEILKLFFLIKTRKISLIHINTNIIGGIPAIIAAKLAAIPCISHIRDTRVPIKREEIFARFVDKLIFINSKAPDLYKKFIPKDKISLIYDSIDLSEYCNIQQNCFRKEFGLNSTPLVGLIGRIVKGKGQKEFILTAKEVLKQKPDIKFVIVGDAKGEDKKYYNEVKELVKINSLEKNIIFTGWRTDTKKIISDLDVFVFASTTFPEGLPNIILEAMALGKPVVATDIPGASEIIINSEIGFLVPPGNIKAMAEKIELLLDNPQLAKTMGVQGRQKAKSCFNIKNTVKKIEELYDEVLRKDKHI